MKFTSECSIRPGKKVRLSDYDPGRTLGFRRKRDALAALAKNNTRLTELQHMLYAENEHALLIVFQAMDAGGKDGTIRHVMSGVNPQGCKVTPFKQPSAEEADHGFLWRIHKAVPGKGEIGIFNRSHYEDVLVARVRKLVPKSVWAGRYQQINDFEKTLAANNVTILKFFLHISKNEQKKRLQERLTDPSKNWKVSESDFEDRKYWDEYMDAYEDALTKCNKSWAPWYIVPSDKKWYRNLVVSEIVVEALEKMNLKYPAPSCDLSRISVN